MTLYSSVYIAGVKFHCSCLVVMKSKYSILQLPVNLYEPSYLQRNRVKLVQIIHKYHSKQISWKGEECMLFFFFFLKMEASDLQG